MKRRALLIGVNQYLPLGDLSYALQEAETVPEAPCKHCDSSSQDITLMTCQSEGIFGAIIQDERDSTDTTKNDEEVN